MRSAWVGAFGVAVAACGGPRAAQPASLTICPAGTMLDPQKNECVAMEPVAPVATDASATPILRPSPPPSATLAVDVTCNFQKGWVALLPASEYPKDDSFLMQALIGLTKEPSFWSPLADYQSLHPYAAQACAASQSTHLVAQAPGDYFLLAGQEDTFSQRGRYDKNGVRRKMTLTSSTQVTLAPRDLTYTWDCISCPWIVFRGSGRDLEPFVVLANRRGRARRGTDVKLVPHVPVVGGRVTLRVAEIEREETHLESLVLRVGGRALARTSPPLRLGPGTQTTMSFAVPGVADGVVDVEVEATGYYDPL